MSAMVAGAAMLAGVVLAAGAARAYPQYIAKGYANCGTCHYSPTGGGLLNSYGHGASQAFAPDVVGSNMVAALRQTLAKHDVTGVDDNDAAALQWDVGLDLRLITLPQGGTLRAIPMLMEAGGVAAYGRWMAYGALTPRRVGPGAIRPFSREVWLRYALNDISSLRIGRIAAPFGLRMADHTQYIREDLGLGKYGQTYALEYDCTDALLVVSAALMAGSLTDTPSHLQERGAAASVGLNLANRASVGVSAMFTRSGAVDRTAAALFGRSRLWQRTYAMAEINAQRVAVREITAGTHQDGLAGYARLGWFPWESLDTYVETGMHITADASALRKRRAGLGADWHVLPWLTLSPQFTLEKLAGSDTVVSALSQVHVIY